MGVKITRKAVPSQDITKPNRKALDPSPDDDITLGSLKDLRRALIDQDDHMAYPPGHAIINIPLFPGMQAQAKVIGDPHHAVVQDGPGVPSDVVRFTVYKFSGFEVQFDLWPRDADVFLDRMEKAIADARALCASVKRIQDVEAKKRNDVYLSGKKPKEAVAKGPQRRGDTKKKVGTK